MARRFTKKKYTPRVNRKKKIEMCINYFYIFYIYTFCVCVCVWMYALLFIGCCIKFYVVIYDFIERVSERWKKEKKYLRYTTISFLWIVKIQWKRESSKNAHSSEGYWSLNWSLLLPISSTSTRVNKIVFLFIYSRGNILTLVLFRLLFFPSSISLCISLMGFDG